MTTARPARPRLDMRADVRVWAPLAALLCLCAPRGAHATPQQALTAGTPCATCHVNVHGGGGRTDIGFGVALYNGALTYDRIGFDWLADRASNDLGTAVVSFGYDARVQSARIGAPEVTIGAGGVDARLSDRQTFLMQLQPYLTVTPHDALDLYLTYSVDQDTFEEGEACSRPYSGQSCVEAMAIVRPHARAPTVRAGLVQPGIGVRHDDHTMYLRADAGRVRSPVIPPNYAELGGDLSYRPAYWFRADGGLYSARNLSSAIGDAGVVSAGAVAYGVRATFSPLFGDTPPLRFATWMGGSVFGAGRFRMDNVFLGVGLMERASLLLESSLLYGARGEGSRARNLSASATLEPRSWLVFHGRVEQGHAGGASADVDNLAVVGGLRFVPLPFFEIRPEYRHTWADAYRTGQYTVQLHAFY